MPLTVQARKAPRRIHQTLLVTPAMAAGVADHAWEIGEMLALLG